MSESVKSQAITITTMENSVRIAGHPAAVRKVMLWVADVVWPGWCENDEGRKIYMGYADSCKDGVVLMARRNFFDAAKTQVMKHLEVDGVEVTEG